MSFIGILVFEGVVDDGGIEAANTLYVGGSGVGNYSTIQAAIDTANPGDIIRVFAGIYYENITINKHLTIIGNGTNNTTIDGNGIANVIEITANWVNITGFNITGAGSTKLFAGIKLFKVNNCGIYNNKCLNNKGSGIYLSDSSNNSVYNCNISENIRDGMILSTSHKNKIYDNNISSKKWNGIRIDSSWNNFIGRNNIFSNNHSGIYINGDNFYNIISNNNIYSNNGYGIFIEMSYNNNISNNNCSNNNGYGIYFRYSSNNSLINCNITTNDDDGIILFNSHNNEIKNNIISKNDRNGIRTSFSDRNSIILNHLVLNNHSGIYTTKANENLIFKNNISLNNGYGIFLTYSDNNSIYNNNISNNSIGIYHQGSKYSSILNNNFYNDNIYITNSLTVGNYFLEFITHNITNNTINGKPIYYFKNSNGINIPFNAGEIILINCSNIEIYDVNCSKGEVGIEIAYSENITIKNSTFSNNDCNGLYIFYSNYTNITNNLIFKNDCGILVHAKSDNTKIQFNEIIYNSYGIICTHNHEIHFNNIYRNSIYGINPLTGAININAINNWWGNISGPYHITKNPTGKGDNVTGDLIFKPWLLGEFGNLAPRIETSDITTAQEDLYYERVYFAIDPNKDSIKWWFNSNATWLNWDIVNNTLYGIPSNADVGKFWVQINITDKKGKYDEHNFTLTVSNVKPLIITNDLNLAYEDSYYENDYNSNDDNQGNITWYLNTNGSWLNIDKYTGILNGMPSNSDVGKCWINISVNDGNGGIDNRNFTLTITNFNDPPIINTEDISIISEDDFYEVLYIATDIDIGDKLKWRCESNATWLYWGSQNQTLYGKPINKNVGSYWVKINVSDQNGGFDENNFILTVLNTNDPPEINYPPNEIFFQEDTVYNNVKLNVWFKDIDGDKLFFNYIGNNFISVKILQNGTIEFEPEPNWNGKETITFFAKDSIFEITDKIIITILGVNDPPINAEIILTKMMYYDEKEQPAIGNATDVDILYGDELTFTWFSNISGFIIKGKKIDLSLPVGLHTVTLNVTDKEGLWSITKKIIRIYKSFNDTDNEIDKDKDGYPDNIDAFPNNPTQWFDSDGDNYGDNPNGTNPDYYPNDPTKWEKEDKKDLDDKTQKDNTAIIGMVILIIILTIIFILLLFLLLKKEKTPKKDNK